MKKLITALGLVAVVAILALVVMARILPAPKEVAELSGADSPYPYSCEMRFKRLHFRIKGDFPEGYRWTAGSSDWNALYVREFKQTENEAHFIITPRSSGLAGVAFMLEREGELPDRIFQINCSFLLGEKREVEDAKASWQELPGAVSGAGEGFTYTVAQSESYALEIAVSGAGTWYCERVGTGAELNGSLQKECMLLSNETEEGKTVHTLTVVATNNEGDGTLYLDSDAGGHIELTYHCTDMGKIALTEHRLGDGDESVRKNEFETFYAEVAERLDYLRGEQSVIWWRSRADEKTEHPAGVIRFYTLCTWTLYVSKEATEADFVGAAESAGGFTAGGLISRYYEDETGVRSVWRANGLNYMLESPDADRAACRAMSEDLMAVLAN